MDLTVYSNDMEKIKRVNFIRKALEGRILKNLKDQHLILKYTSGGIIDDNVLDCKGVTMLSNNELDYLNETISEALKYSFLYNDIDELIDVATRFKASDYRSRGEIVKEIETIISEIQTKFRRARVESSSEMTFSLRKGRFEESVADIHSQLSNPSRKLYTGMQGVNELLGGCFESGRVYLFLGNAGTGKSNTLLNFAKQIKKFNPDYKAKDPTKIPVIVYLTMENTVRESVARLYTLVTGKEDMTQYSLEEVINQLRTEGELYLRDDSPIDIIIKYVPDKSVDTGYLYTLTEDLEDEGYEVICMMQDHIKRIRSAYKTTEIRFELGEIINQFKTFSAIKDIPLITVSHLNRDGARTIDEGMKANKFDLIRQLGRANVGESMLMIDNVDCAYLIGLEYDQSGNKYMGFKRIKSRVKTTIRDYLAQPFTTNDGLALVEDMYAKVPVFKDSLKPNAAEVQLYNNGINQKEGTYNTIQDIDTIIKNNNHNQDPSDENIFSADGYNKASVIYMGDDDIDEETVSPVITGMQSHSELPQLLVHL